MCCVCFILSRRNCWVIEGGISCLGVKVIHSRNCYLAGTKEESRFIGFPTIGKTDHCDSCLGELEFVSQIQSIKYEGTDLPH